MKKISCIIPSYNEEKRIGNILQALSGHPLLHEVIVVDDGSRDATHKIVAQFPDVKLITNTKNQGKSVAVCNGIKAAQSDFILLLDADLIGLTSQNITDLITPVAHNVADVSISLRSNAPGIWRRLGIDYISGERVFPKHLLENHIDEIRALRPFGLEVFFNRWIIKHKCKIKIVSWRNVASPYKYKKYGWYTGITSDIKMIFDILSTTSIFEPVYQIWKMMKLRV